MSAIYYENEKRIAKLESLVDKLRDDISDMALALLELTDKVDSIISPTEADNE